MADQTNRIPIPNERVLAGDLLVDGHEHFLLSQQLQQMPKLNTLSLNQLANRHGPIEFAC